MPLTVMFWTPRKPVPLTPMLALPGSPTMVATSPMAFIETFRVLPSSTVVTAGASRTSRTSSRRRYRLRVLRVPARGSTAGPEVRDFEASPPYLRIHDRHNF